MFLFLLLFLSNDSRAAAKISQSLCCSMAPPGQELAIRIVLSPSSSSSASSSPSFYLYHHSIINNITLGLDSKKITPLLSPGSYGKVIVVTKLDDFSHFYWGFASIIQTTKNIVQVCNIWLVFGKGVSKECEFVKEIDRKIK